MAGAGLTEEKQTPELQGVKGLGLSARKFIATAFNCGIMLLALLCAIDLSGIGRWAAESTSFSDSTLIDVLAFSLFLSMVLAGPLILKA